MKAMIAAAAVLALALPAVASAQSWGGRDGGGRHHYNNNGGWRDGGGYRGNNGYRGDNGYRGNNGWRGDRDWRGDSGRYRHRQSNWYRRGGYLPPYYSGYVVQDYGRYHLRRPPRGYYWYRTGDDYVLAAIASGLIFDIIASGQNDRYYGGY